MSTPLTAAEAGTPGSTLAPVPFRRVIGDPVLEEEPLEILDLRGTLRSVLTVEICAGSSRISHFCSQAGLTVCPPLDLEHSSQCDLASADVMLWLVQMLREGRLLSAFVSPPCTTFSRLALRTDDPCIDHSRPRVRVGNILAQRALAILFTARTYSRGAGGEQPRRSKMAWLGIWRALALLPGAKECFLSACQFGSIHRKIFRLIGVNVDFSNCARPCRGGHTHVRIEGRYTKDSAIYPEALVREIAVSFCSFVASLRGADRADSGGVAGLESPIVNDLLAGRVWELERVTFLRQGA